MDFNDMQSMNFGCYFEAVLQEDSHIRQKYFNVTIPSIFPNVENSFTPSTNTRPISSDRNYTNREKGSGNADLVTTTIIKALNHTDYYFKLKGDTLKEEMDSTDGITEPISVVEGAYTDFKSHKHEIKKPITLNNYIYKNLNNVMVPKNTKCYGFFLNGTYDTTSFVIVRIEGAVPLQEKDIINYQK